MTQPTRGQQPFYPLGLMGDNTGRNGPRDLSNPPIGSRPTDLADHFADEVEEISQGRPSQET